MQSRYDDNDDGGAGAGLFLDDIKIYKISGGNYPAPIGLTAEPGDSEAMLSWYDMNASGTDDDMVSAAEIVPELGKSIVSD